MGTATKKMNTLKKIFTLCKGDILVRHGKDQDITKALNFHIAVVAQPALTQNRIPAIFDMVRSLGFSKRLLPCDLTVEKEFNDVWSVFRLNDEMIPAKAASIGHIWVCMNESAKYVHSVGRTSARGTYSVSSTVSSFFGDACFGAKAIHYAKYLCVNCTGQPPAELQSGHSGWFSGAICTYLPIALYQTACRSTALIHNYMAIDARRALPKDLVNYLNGNPNWAIVDQF
ncbi:hypothetical protein NX722_24770 [Endozoicomonas gorgoniicola]|uniref:Uncharacterized protein n=1 Tax=Endozoicomonas gorgoniicola TaxID=1234144 RepID=A0ABT3N2B6_9GAMM|nr:hypothetical protein [Endozoicomonas gorgoniicola]MCW7555780.1 hypothetical protein [Endozoicomonas gorgoniicola]